ncbi:hypothetical protein CYL17_01255 [Thermobispora bispora]|nr:hypothetical protein CYL17_01255 [Thermobispora bispora]
MRTPGPAPRRARPGARGAGERRSRARRAGSGPRSGRGALPLSVRGDLPRPGRVTRRVRSRSRCRCRGWR